ncbi:MAG TPA: FtsX-like permease family protein, partial [Micromonosporaceae bacterium]|nr:FtsX-like permease family protein [Micromonosporaceae bacterium]
MLRRAAMARTLLIAAALTATLTTALLTAFLQYARLLPDEGTRAALMKMPAQQRSLLISGAGGTNAADLVAREEYIQDRFAHGLGGMPVSAIGGGYAIGQQLPDGLGATISRAGGTYAVVAFLDRLPEHATLVSGDWPKPVARTEPAQVALAERTASVLRVGVGDRIPVNDRRTGWPAPLTVVGVFRPIDPDGPYWQLAADPVNNGGYGPLVVDREEFRARYAALSTLEWVVAPTPAALTSADLPAVAGALDELRYAGLPGPDKAWFPSLRTGLDDLAGRLTTTRLVSRSGLLLPALLIIVIAGYALFLVARLLADQRRGELSLLRARGAAGTQLARLALGEALLVVTPAALLGAPLGGALLRLGDVWSTGHGLRLAAVAGNGAIGWMIALAAAAGCAAALVLPAARRGGSWVAEQQRRPRPSRWTTVQRAGVDAALVAVAVLAWLQLRQYAGPLTRVGGSLDIDPLLVAAPVVGVLAATAVSLRLLPAATRVGVGAAQRRDSHATLLGMWHADRRPHAGPVLLLVLAVAASALASCVAASWQRSQRDQAAHAVGTDLRLTRAGGEQLQLSTGDLAGPGVRAASTAYRTKLNAGNESAELIAIDTAAAPDVVRLRGDLAEPDALRRLAAARPAVPGQVLPAGTRRLTGHIGYVARVRNNVGEAVPGVLTAILDDGSGTLYHRELGQPRADGTLDF